MSSRTTAWPRARAQVLEVAQQPRAQAGPAPVVVHPHPLHLGRSVGEPLHSPARHRLAIARRDHEEAVGRRHRGGVVLPGVAGLEAEPLADLARSTPPSPPTARGSVGAVSSSRTVAARTSRSAVASASVSRSRCRSAQRRHQVVGELLGPLVEPSPRGPAAPAEGHPPPAAVVGVGPDDHQVVGLEGRAAAGSGSRSRGRAGPSARARSRPPRRRSRSRRGAATAPTAGPSRGTTRRGRRSAGCRCG